MSVHIVPYLALTVVGIGALLATLRHPRTAWGVLGAVVLAAAALFFATSSPDAHDPIREGGVADAEAMAEAERLANLEAELSSERESKAEVLAERPGAPPPARLAVPPAPPPHKPPRPPSGRIVVKGMPPTTAPAEWPWPTSGPSWDQNGLAIGGLATVLLPPEMPWSEYVNELKDNACRHAAESLENYLAKLRKSAPGDLREIQEEFRRLSKATRAEVARELTLQAARQGEGEEHQFSIDDGRIATTYRLQTRIAKDELRTAIREALGRRSSERRSSSPAPALAVVALVVGAYVVLRVSTRRTLPQRA